MPFTHSFIDGETMKPCCMFEGEGDVREQFLAGIKPEGCKPCFDKEERGGTSSRQYYNQRYDFLPLDKVRTFDLRIDDVCNLKCVMCGPDQSTKWREDIEIFDEFVGRPLWNRKIPLPDLSDALEISILGGEPFYMRTAENILKKQSRDTRIILNTNACIDADNKLLGILKEFDVVEIVISIDGYKQVNDYIRFPSEWDKFESGIDIIFSLDNIEYKPFNTTVSCLNLPDLDNIKNYTKQYSDYKHYINYLTDPDFLSINALPPKVIEYCDVDVDYEFDKKLNQKMRAYLSKLDKKRNTNSKRTLPWCWIDHSE